jgi:serine/threonine protein kinase
MIFTMFECIAESVVVKGIVSLAKEIPFGNTLFDVASDAWRRMKLKKADAAMRAEVQLMAQAAHDEVKAAAASAASHAYPKDREKAIELELYLTQIPAAVRQSLRRQDDPTGTTVPLAFTLDKPEDLLPLLPMRVSRFRPGDGLPGRDGWKLTDLLGTGGFGEVWLATHPHFASLKRAVKFCLELNDRDRTLLHEGGLIDRVMRAGPVPNVVPLIDANLTGEAPWLMYEYVPGGDLVSLVAGWRKLAAVERQTYALGALRQIASAVAHFHRLGVVHRDLKPANVLVEPASSDREPTILKVADFGIGGVSASHELALELRVTSSGTRQATVARGAFTPIYASPQQKRGNAADPRDDVFALGVIGYQLLLADVTAERPGGKGWRRAMQAEGMQAELLDVLESCWDDSPSERPSDAGELLDRLPREHRPVPVAPAMPLPPGHTGQVRSLDEAEEPRGSRLPLKTSPPVPDTEPPKVAGPWSAVLALAGLVLLAVLIVGGIIAVWAVSGGGDTHPTMAVSKEAPSWIVGNWNPRDDTKPKPGVKPDIVYTFTSDWKVTWTASGKLVANGRFQLPSPEVLTIDWSGKTEKYDAILLPGESFFTLRRQNLNGATALELRYAGE